MNFNKLLWAKVCLPLLFLSFVIYAPLQAQDKSSKKKKGAVAEEKPKEKPDEIKPIKEVTKKCKAYKGLFTFYQDTTSGDAYMSIKKEQLHKEFIYFVHVANGFADANTFKGAYSSNKVFTIQPYFNKIEFRFVNTAYYYDPNNALSKAANANINSPVIYSEKIAGMDKESGEVLISVDKLFLSEALEQIKESPNPQAKAPTFTLGSLSKDKNKYVAIKNYPQNSDIFAEYVFENPYPVVGGDVSVTDARYSTIQLQHSFIEMPQNDYKPRYDDPRVGYFATQVTDMTTMSETPYRDVVHRWHLVKKDPSAALSEPIEPITWWIENTTPKELRPHIKAGVLQWNKAFEKAGFKNAVVVYEQSDTATWDAGDIRYNVLRWTASPQPFFGGYGPSFVNPRTGQILGADVMLEYTFLMNRLRVGKGFESSALDYLDFEKELEKQHHFSKNHCLMASHLHQNMMFGSQMLDMREADKLEKEEFTRQALYMLVLHEVGHTLGLNHNMRASHLHNPTEIHNKELGETIGLTGSVMDYAQVNVSPNPEKQGLYFDVIPGAYDIWAIQFGYSTDESQLKNLLNQSAKHELAFGNDADDMRASGIGIDPRVMIGDMTSDPVKYATERIQMIQKQMPKLKGKYATTGESYQALLRGYFVMTGEYGIALRVISRQIGGVYVDRTMVGQEGAGKPFSPVSYETQKKAMTALKQYAFSSDAFKLSDDLYNYLQAQRRGFNHYGKNEDPKIHSRILNIQQDLLNQLLHPNVLQRITDAELYGNKYKLSEYLPELTDAIFKEDASSTVNTMRQNLQIEYLERLARGVNSFSPYLHNIKSMLWYELNRIKKMMQNGASPDTATKAHREHIVWLISRVLDDK
jgi:hypothetical protein